MEKDTIVGMIDQDFLWWDQDEHTWTSNVFAATKFTPNDATLLTHRMKEGNVQAYTEHIMVAAKRWQEKVKGEV